MGSRLDILKKKLEDWTKAYRSDLLDRRDDLWLDPLDEGEYGPAEKKPIVVKIPVSKIWSWLKRRAKK